MVEDETENVDESKTNIVIQRKYDEVLKLLIKLGYVWTGFSL